MDHSDVSKVVSGTTEAPNSQGAFSEIATNLPTSCSLDTTYSPSSNDQANGSLSAMSQAKKETKYIHATNSSEFVSLETNTEKSPAAAQDEPIDSESTVVLKRKNDGELLVAPDITSDNASGVPTINKPSVVNTIAANKKARLVEGVDLTAPIGMATDIGSPTSTFIGGTTLTLTEPPQDGGMKKLESQRSESGAVGQVASVQNQEDWNDPTSTDGKENQFAPSGAEVAENHVTDGTMDDASRRERANDADANINSGNSNDDDPSQEKRVKETNNGSAANTNSTSKSSTLEPGFEFLEIVSKYVELPKLKSSRPAPLKSLTKSEREELESFFDINQDRGSSNASKVTWYKDWLGNIEFADVDISNPDGRASERSVKAPLLVWAQKGGKKSLRALNNLVRHIYNHKDTPNQAKKILGNADPTSAESLELALRRCSYDPVVLQQDGWSTAKPNQREGASGRAYRIGEKVFWQGFEGVVIAYTHEADMGDLWKAMWLEDTVTFDLEVEELEEGRRKHERRSNRPRAGDKKVAATSSAAAAEAERRSTRNVSTADFQVNGIEHGIVLATSYSRGARHGVFWPARVIHASELLGQQSKRSSKQKVDVVFLAPYWNSDPALLMGTSRRTESFSDSIARHGDALFSSGALFELESIDANDESIQAYPYDSNSGLDIDEIWSAFKFSGLPKAAFARFLDSHRLALGLRAFSERELKSTGASDVDRTSASLLEGHPLSVQTANFPHAVLNLPFEHILSRLPHPAQETWTKSFSEFAQNGEPALQLGRMLDSMKPPECWGLGTAISTPTKESLMGAVHRNSFTSPQFSLEQFSNCDDETSHDLTRWLSGFQSLQDIFSEDTALTRMLTNNLNETLQGIPSYLVARRGISKSLYKGWIVMKTFGEALISSYRGERGPSALKDWRRCCERIYSYLNERGVENEQVQSGRSLVLTDSRCNLHLTSSECFERPVRLPAALKAAREAKGSIRIATTVDDKYMELAEKHVILRAHKKSYIQRIKARCLSAVEDNVVPLTEDSEGHGGEDTKGSKGSWTAAVAAVAAALQATDMIMSGECTNAFCPTRPPGHHAGRELHAMKAVSNGFCVLNAVACAAMYATTPISEGGLGLSRVCVIDIDVHHGNGTQDILCSTFDPRFLYVSIHAGGAHVNGVDLGEDGEQILAHHLGRSLNKKGIFPGRCGDISPHDGVLNIPLGSRVTSHALGTALVTKVSPTVDRFSPELIIISAGFDAHKNDPLNMGGLEAQDFGTLTEVICKLAHKSCSGRVLSVLEGGYGVPCCRPQYFPPGDVAMKAHIDGKNDEEEAPSSLSDQTVPRETKDEGALQVVSPFQDSNVNDKEEVVVGLTPREKSDVSIEKSDGNQGIQGIDYAGEPTERERSAISQSTATDETPKLADGGVANGLGSTSSNFIEVQEDQIVPLQCLELGEDLPPDMKDIVASYALQKRLDKCHAEGFLHCVREHVSALARCSARR